MDLDKRLVLTRNLFLQPVGPNSYAARASFASDQGVQLDPGTMALLSCFLEPNTPRAAVATLGSSVSTTEEHLSATVDELVGHGLLRLAEAAAGESVPVAGSGYAQALTHHPMLIDAARVDAYRIAIERLAPGKRVLEIGTGSGVLSMFAARAGAAEVVALEESGVVALARALAQENGLEDRIRFVPCNSLDYRPAEPADLLVHELIGHEPFSEHALRYLEDARRRLVTQGGQMVPSAIELHCRAVARTGWTDRRRLQLEMQQMSQRFGLSFEAFGRALAATPPLPVFDRDVPLVATGGASDDALLYRADFLQPIAAQGIAEPVEQTLRIARGGVINALLVHFRVRMTDDLWLSNAPEAPRTHWAVAIYDLPEPRQVEPGDELTVRARLEAIAGAERLLVEL
jgi:ribosomal protein L11 methylase PrmA